MPERLDEFMARANAAYYATHDPFADFTTAPEITQMFGELIGAWAAVTWALMGAPVPLILAEAGPGRATLMRDVLRATARVAPDFRAACHVHFIETSPRLRAVQAEAVPGAAWHDSLDDLPAGPAILLANEFLDALPIRQFVRRGAGWMERFVAEGRFVEQHAHMEREAPEGSVVEVNDAASAWIIRLASRLVGQGGAALILDYGTLESLPGDSLQALRCGRPADPLRDIGSADLTAHVDFAAVGRQASACGAAVWGPVTQGDFLDRLGLRHRAASLARANPQRAAEFAAAMDRLAAPARMGTLFKVVCLAHPALPAPPGFAA
jgi:SAM-dependent MidA family methyltransferase